MPTRSRKRSPPATATGARPGVIDLWERPDESLRAITVSDHVDGAMLRTNETVSAIIHSAGNETVRTIVHSARHDDADAE
jgi:hypothetical protein